jgi:RHS repeat-associated protein
LRRSSSVLRLFLVFSLIISLIPSWISVGKTNVLAEEAKGGNKVKTGQFEVVDLRTEKSKTFVNDDGTLTSKIYETPIHYKENEKWVPINNELVETPNSTTVENKANRFKVKFEKNNLNNKLVNLSMENSSFTMTPVKNEDNVPQTTMKQQQQSVTETKENDISYNDIYPGVDINYSIGNQKVKEDIILQEKPLESTPTKYSFKLDITNLSYEKQDDGSILFSDLNKQPLFYIDRPYMFDSFVPSGYQKLPNITSIPEEALSHDVVMNIVERDDELFIDIVPNRDWLMDSKRVYPVVIDPTIVMIQPKTEGIDTTIRSSHPTLTGGGETDTTVGLQKGDNGFTKVLRSLYKFDLSSIPGGASILNADLNLWMSSVSNDTPIQVDAHEITKPWTENGATWNSTGSTTWTNNGGDYIATPIDSVSGIGNHLDLSFNLNWDITSTVKKWSGTPSSNNGLLLKSSNESTDSYKKFISSDSANTEYTPMLAVTYYSGSRLGLENYWTFDEHVLTNDTSYVNITTGNHVLQANDVSIAGRGGMDVNFTRTYNYKDFEDSPLGYGWTYPGNEKIIKNWEDNKVLYSDSDGTRHIFTYDTTTQSYKAPAGIYLTLTQSNNDFTITDKYGYKTVYKGTIDREQDITVARISYSEDLHGNKITYTYDTGNKLISITDPSGRKVTINYYSSGRISEVIDITGTKVAYSYDTNGNLINVDRYVNSTEYLRTTYSYSGNHNLISVIDTNNRKTDFAYNGAITKVQLPYGEADLVDRPGSTYTIDINNYVSSSTDAEGNVTNFTSNSNYILTKVTDSLGYSRSFTLDNNYNVLQETDAIGNITINTYDSKGNQISTKDPEGNTSSWTYNGLSLVTSEKDPKDNTTNYQYNGYGDLIKTIRADLKEILYTYDTYGNLLTVTDEDGKVTRFQYDTLGNYLSESNNPLENKVVFGNDAKGNVNSFFDSKAHETKFEYNSRELLTKVIDPNLAITQYEYDKAGNKIKTIDANGNVIQFTYDGKGQNTKIINPLNKSTSYLYDKIGNVNQIISPNGDSLGFTYDANNQLIQSSVNGLINWKYTYDPNGNVKTISDRDNQVISFQYDKNNHLLNETKGQNILEFNYDAIGNIIKSTRTNGNQTTQIGFTYDTENRLESITKELLPLSNYTYNPVGNISSIQLGNGNYTNIEFNAAQQVTAFKNYTNSGQVLNEFVYTYDPNGNQISVITEKGTNSVEYDKLNQIIKENLSDGTIINYEYDKVGNRIKKQVAKNGNTSVSSYTYNQADQLIALNGLTYQYDNNGNLINDGLREYVYDQENQLVEVKDLQGSSIAKYSYDHEGKRIKKVTPTETINYFYDGDKVIYETDQNQSKINEYIWDNNGRPVSLIKDGKTYYYHLNRHGDVTALTDSNGNIVAQYEYDSWGNILNKSGSLSDINPYRYSGYRYDKETNFYYLMSRYYDSSNGRFISRDSYLGEVVEPLSLNLYTYTHNNPIMFTDSSGYARSSDNLGGGIVNRGGGGVAPISGNKGGGNTRPVVQWRPLTLADAKKAGFKAGKKFNEQKKSVPSGKYKGRLGWEDKNGDIWVPAKAGESHGGLHFDVQLKSTKYKTHKNVFVK